MADSTLYSEDVLTERIIECVIRVHQALGPGFLECIYQNALLIELELHGLRVEREREILIHYAGRLIGKHKLDLVVEQTVILELKAVDELSRAHYAQVRSYLRASGLKTALLINFAKEKADFRRISLG